MSFGVEANKLAPKLTVVFQLTVWGIVGIFLIQKGAISLYEKTKTRNDTRSTQENVATWNEEGSIVKGNIAGRRSQLAKVQTRASQENVVTVDDPDGPERWSRGLRVSHPTTNSVDGHVVGAISSGGKQTTVRHWDDTRDTRSIETAAPYATSPNKARGTRDDGNVVRPSLYDGKITASNRNESILESTKSISATAVAVNQKASFEHDNSDASLMDSEKMKSERNSGRSPVSRIGAGIAIVMLAIGIVMLLLGPLIVIVRAISNRWRTRDMLLKSRCYNDQPPSYEEATLMDQAPRYSSLELNAIFQSSSL